MPPANPIMRPENDFATGWLGLESEPEREHRESSRDKRDLAFCPITQTMRLCIGFDGIPAVPPHQHASRASATDTVTSTRYNQPHKYGILGAPSRRDDNTQRWAQASLTALSGSLAWFFPRLNNGIFNLGQLAPWVDFREDHHHPTTL
ncbi:hypothetical protein JDV02_007286 [Purpureocillium takamizusanense]|uniref:Uncharacterized protein n=1 Tax=Purpureocillium takamizusanense TaxID=2060973 RepID=A0A9Q8QM73_9HYPO|nr:uncharacterized protein JDV02_007286 [Purpureocillium takamizusanense]UNI21284.1 hypothetical protein JDV02_007286 [Purpureocillium takamizusanense]